MYYKHTGYHARNQLWWKEHLISRIRKPTLRRDTWRESWQNCLKRESVEVTKTSFRLLNNMSSKSRLQLLTPKKICLQERRCLMSARLIYWCSFPKILDVILHSYNLTFTSLWYHINQNGSISCTRINQRAHCGPPVFGPDLSWQL